MDEQEKARKRLAVARGFLTDAIEAISGPDPDWALCQVLIDMAGEVLPYVESGGES